MTEQITAAGPATAREAAVKILLGDIAPLFQRARELQDNFTQLQGTQQAIHAELNADIQRLGAMMAGLSEEAQKIRVSGADAARTLQRCEHLVEHLETAALPRLSHSVRTPHKSDGGAPVWLVVVLVMLLCVAVLGAGLLFWQQKQNSNALAAGHATLKAWPQLGEGARKTIEAAGRR